MINERRLNAYRISTASNGLNITIDSGLYWCYKLNSVIVLSYLGSAQIELNDVSMRSTEKNVLKLSIV